MDTPTRTFYGAVHRLGDLVSEETGAPSTMNLLIEPKELRAGVSIAATFTDFPSGTSEIEIVPFNRAQSRFRVPLKHVAGIKQIAEFTILSPGEYQIQNGNFTQTFSVAPQVDLNFSREFGISVVLILITLMGTILWARRFKRKTAR